MIPQRPYAYWGSNAEELQSSSILLQTGHSYACIHVGNYEMIVIWGIGEVTTRASNHAKCDRNVAKQLP